jgi:hypothetical protein
MRPKQKFEKDICILRMTPQSGCGPLCPRESSPLARVTVGEQLAVATVGFLSLAFPCPASEQDLSMP